MFNLAKQISNTTLNLLACNDFNSMIVTNTSSSDITFSLACGRHEAQASGKQLLTNGSLVGDSDITDINKGIYILKDITVPVGVSLKIPSMNCKNFYNEIPEDKFFLNKQGKYNRRHTRDSVATADSKRLSSGSQKRWKFFGQINSGTANIIIKK